MEIRTLGIIGHGSFGALIVTLTARFASTVSVKIYSSRSAPDGVRFFSLEEVAACDAVVLAVPIHAFENILKKVAPLTKPDTILVDVATVKLHTAALLEKDAGGRPYLALHPMFGPYSYEKRGNDVAGFRIVATGYTIPQHAFESLKAFGEELGFNIIEMTSESHDRHLAETLFLTHLVGQVVTEGKFGRTEIDTVSFGFLMDAVESVRNDTELFKDVYRFNPYSKEVLARFEDAADRVKKLLDADLQNSEESVES